MPMLGWPAAWRKFATPVERAVAKATRDVDPDVAAEVIARARRAGYVVTFRPTSRKQRRGRRRR